MADVEKSQADKFKELAKKVNADESESAFDDALKRITKPENDPKSAPKNVNEKRTED